MASDNNIKLTKAEDAQFDEIVGKISTFLAYNVDPPGGKLVDAAARAGANLLLSGNLLKFLRDNTEVEDD